MIVTRAFLEKLFSSFSLPLLYLFETPGLVPNDTLPSGVSEEEVAYICAFVLCAGIYIFSADLSPAGFRDDGIGHSFNSPPPNTGLSGNGYVEVETALVRLDKFWAPNASFPVWSQYPIIQDPGSYWNIGYDAIVCVKMYEPWIVQIYNSSLGVPTTMTIVRKSATADFETDYGKGDPYLDSYTQALNYTGKDSAYYNGYAGGFSFERC